VNEEALTRWELLRQKKERKKEKKNIMTSNTLILLVCLCEGQTLKYSSLLFYTVQPIVYFPLHTAAF